MKDWILLVLAAAVFFDGLTNMVLARTIRRHLKATTDLAALISSPIVSLRNKEKWKP
jgi:hypothetical protein